MLVTRVLQAPLGPQADGFAGGARHGSYTM